MYYYSFNKHVFISNKKYDDFHRISEDEARISEGYIYALMDLDALTSRRSFVITDPSLLYIESEGVELLKAAPESAVNVPSWIIERINFRKVIALNKNYPGWEDVTKTSFPDKWRVNIAGLGDVGGMLITGLRLLGGDCISSIGIYDIDINKVNRWEREVSQILPAFHSEPMPSVIKIDEDDIFNCDMFIFCVSRGVPPIGEEGMDVRMAQFKGNSKIINYYAKKARNYAFKGIFAVVSDPVDLLCKSAFLSSNTDKSGKLDFMGLAPDQIRGYGLGVMNARAAYFAQKEPELEHFLHEGRVFGPHGDGLIVADSIRNYNHELSIYLTEKTKKANLEIRKAGHKPYIAPALSSGSLSLLATIRGEWHYSATFLGGVFMGAKNRLTSKGTELERLDIPDALFERIKLAYETLAGIL
ncbi:lactate/malate family dehydrogenase [Fonticella tunisiensis]|uniref:Malate/lactate dehydrogenase n=1 Tax=Fonticella tunisiensis TaxID=1096341 RepID=A0A4R7KPW6_9CLOT|nr:lactate dehydrogenase [Fonticella tunisiensis]TDT61161.1 malate/lactate dehydrogenase [Fonticella tunisiensis]